MPVKPMSVTKKIDLAAKFNRPVSADHPNVKATQFKVGDWDEMEKTRDPVTGQILPGGNRNFRDLVIKPKGQGGRPKGSNNQAVKAIKEYMIELLDDDKYRAGLTRRIKSGELPQIELFLLTKALGKPKEEIEITQNVPLFALPPTFLLQEDVVEPESVKLIEEGTENGADKVRE